MTQAAGSHRGAEPLRLRVRSAVASLLVFAGVLAPGMHAVAHAQGVDTVPAAPEVTAGGAVLWDPADERVLYGKQETLARPMASTTKIMTVLLALEAGAADETLVVSEQAERIGRTPGGATLGLRAGDTLPVEDVLAALMLRSGNDAAVAVAEHVAGSEEAFVARMNRRAAELGLQSTTFVNASGLTDDPEHAASPVDLARLAQIAMAREPFAAWAGAPRLDVPGIGTIANRNQLLVTFEGATGVKTGYTSLAGLCLVASATRDGRTLYAVVLDSDDSFGDAAALLEHGFTAYRRVEVFAAGEEISTYRWPHAAVGLVAEQALSRTVRQDSAVTWRTVVKPTAATPVNADTVLGEVELLVDGDTVDRARLRAEEAVPAPPPASPSSTVGSAVQDTIRSYLRLQPLEGAA